MRDSRDLRIAAIFIVAFTSFLGTLVAPAVIRVAELATSRRKSNTRAEEDEPESSEAVARSRASASDLVQRALRVLGAFSTGIVLGTSTLHLLPEAIIFMDEATNDGPGSHPSAANAAAVCANGSVATSPAEVLEDVTAPFPWAELIMVLTVFAMFIFEKELFALVERRTAAAAKKKAAKAKEEAEAQEAAAADEHTVIDTISNSEPTCVEDAPAVKPTTTADDSPDTEEASAKERAMAIVYSHVVELALSVHSVILGLTVGLLTEYATVRVLVIAVSIDQFSDGVAVGSTLCQSKALSFWHAAGLRAFFAWTCSIGIAIGVGIEQEGGSGDPMAQGILASMSAGLLLLLAMGEMLPGIVRPFSHRGGHCHGPATPEPSPAVGPADVVAGRETSVATIGEAASTSHEDTEEEPSDSVSTPWRWVLYLCMCVGFAGMAIISVYGG
jgi:zinc transporter ZupT